jgi:acetyltransferase
VAVIGPLGDPANPGRIIMKNLLQGAFVGPVMPVTGKVEAISGVLAYQDVDTLPLTPDLAVITADPREVPDYVHKLGVRGTKAALLLSPEFRTMEDEERTALLADISARAAEQELRLLGPGSIGLISPNEGLNASLAHTDALPGRMAFVTQSDDLFATVLDWATSNEIGFSCLVSLGDQIDVSFHQVLDYLGSDPHTRSILLYIESIRDARRFMSAARASARNKPILVIKPGRIMDTLDLMAGERSITDIRRDDIYDVAFRRAGIVRVDEIDALFDGAQTLARSKPLRGEALTILTNGKSVGLLAADACLAGGGRLSEFSDETNAKLIDLLGERYSGANPVVLPAAAEGELYVKAMQILLKDTTQAAVLIMHSPVAERTGEEAAQAVLEAAKKAKRTVLTSWLGSKSAAAARKLFAEAGVATYDTPDKAIRAFTHMVDYRRNQELLMETPDSLPADFFPDTDRTKAVIDGVLDDGRTMLNDFEAREVLAAYGVPFVETRSVVGAQGAMEAATELGFPVALKIRSPQIEQPFDVGGVALDLETPDQVWDAAAAMLGRVNKLRPDAYIEGYVVQQMGRRPSAQELLIGVEVDPIFGPVVRFGHGGMATRASEDQAVALPPLNMSLASELIGRTRISRLFVDRQGEVRVDEDDVCLTLIQVTQLVIDEPRIRRLIINPLFADAKGVLALGAQIEVGQSELTGPERLAIRPYPRELEEAVKLKDDTKVLLRPIRPEDAPEHYDFVKSLSPEDLRLRFFGAVYDFEPKDMARFTQIDYDREMAFIATVRDEEGEPKTLGVVRATTSPDNEEAEFAIIIRSEMKGKGLGSLLFDKIIRYCKSRGTHWLIGQALPENKAMVGLSKRYGFKVVSDMEDDFVEMRLELNPPEEGSTEMD